MSLAFQDRKKERKRKGKICCLADASVYPVPKKIAGFFINKFYFTVKDDLKSVLVGKAY